MKFITKIIFILLFIIPCSTFAQGKAAVTISSETKPYKIGINGKQLSLKCNQQLSSFMIWTADGHRIVEQKDIKSADYSCTIPVNSRIIFLMIKFSSGKVYTEKIGL